MMLKIFATPVAIVQSVASICHISFGAGVSNRRGEPFGRLYGWGVTNHDAEGSDAPSPQTAPPDREPAVPTEMPLDRGRPMIMTLLRESLRSATIASSRTTGVLAGDVSGRLERASNPAKPSSRHRPAYCRTSCGVMPHSRRTCDTFIASPATNAITAAIAFIGTCFPVMTHRHRPQGVTDVPRHQLLPMSRDQTAVQVRRSSHVRRERAVTGG